MPVDREQLKSIKGNVPNKSLLTNNLFYPEKVTRRKTNFLQRSINRMFKYFLHSEVLWTPRTI